MERISDGKEAQLWLYILAEVFIMMSTLGVRGMVDKENVVKKGYDGITEEYQANRGKFDHRKELTQFAALLPENAKILDVGCGAGVPVAQFLAEYGFDVTGIDFSENMLKLARKNVPKATFINKDMNELDFAANSFDGLTAFYSIIHVPKEKHYSLFESFHRVLKPEGMMLVCMGPDEWEATDEYLGTTMFWSQYSPEKSLQLVKNAGFQIVSDQILARGGEKHYWIMARNKK
jgi:ubiquinone/menaquinone biosynthesis C-methylase UbiE